MTTFLWYVGLIIEIIFFVIVAAAVLGALTAWFIAKLYRDETQGK